MKKLSIGLFCLFCTGLYGQGVPYGREFQVIASTVNYQQNPQIESLSNGGFVVCWQSLDQAGSKGEVYGQVFSSDGTIMNKEFSIQKNSEGSPANPRIVSLLNGDFVVCWQIGLDWGFGIHGQIFTSNGSKEGNEFRINTYTGSQQDPQITPLLNGGFVVCWSSWNQDGSEWGIYGQVFLSDGNKLGDEFQVNSYTNYWQYNPQIVSLPNGGFVICWQSDAQDGYGLGVYGQVFESDGTKVGGEFRVNSTTMQSQENPRITSLPNGGFVICWISGDNDGRSRVYCQIFSSDGNKIGGEFCANTTTVNHWQSPAQILSLSNGGFIICWIILYGPGESYCDIYGQVFASDGTKIGSEFLVNTYIKLDQTNPSATSLSNGGFIICWMSWNQDGSEWGIYGQLFSSLGTKVGNEFQINTYSEGSQFNPQISTLSNNNYLVCWQNGYFGSPSGVSINAKRFPESPLVHLFKQFDLLEPLNDSSIMIVNPTVNWQQPSNQLVCHPWELHYKIFVSDNPDFSSPQIFEHDQDTTLTLQNLTPGTTYFWKVLAKNIAGDSLWSTNTNAFFVSRDATGVQEVQTHSPNQFILHQNYPNPFNPETTIYFDLPENGDIEISIYDISGKPVKVLLHETRIAGSHSVKWDSKDSAGHAMPSGIYICRMEAKTASGKIYMKSLKMGLVR